MLVRPFCLFCDTGMVFGMTARAPLFLATPIWQVWDSFGIDQAEMIGWWDVSPPITVSVKAAGSDADALVADDDVRATAYVRWGNA